MAFLIQKWESIDYVPKAASTVFNAGEFIGYNGTGEVVPLNPTVPVLGVILEDVTAGDVDYTSLRKVPYQVARGFKFIIEVTTGAATANDIGLPFDIDAGNSAGLDVSAPGTQFVIREFISATLVAVEPILLA